MLESVTPRENPESDDAALSNPSPATWAPSHQDPPPDSPWTHKLVMGTAVVVPFIGFLAAVALMWSVGWMGWLYLALMLCFWAITSLGITVGFHRLLSHRSFDTYRWVRAVWTALGALSVEGSPLIWCAVHRRHHAYSDLEGDPHSPHLHGGGIWEAVKGFAYAHTGWLFTGYWTSPQLKKYIPDLLSDRMLVWVDKIYYVWVLLSLLAPAAIAGLITMSWQGALLGLVWGGLVRIFMTHHITWSINSVCHLFGSRQYDSRDQSRNNAICGILAFGEGWHNNHHAFPTSARHGLAWWQFDSSWLVIRGMEMLGLAWNLRVPSETALATKRLPKAN